MPATSHACKLEPRGEVTRLGAYFRAGERFRIAGDLDLDLARSADRSLWRMMREATT